MTSLGTHIDRAARALEDPAYRSVTVFVSPKYTVRATRQRKVSKRDQYRTIILTCGVPNYDARRRIKVALKTFASPFPFTHRQPWPKKRAKKK